MTLFSVHGAIILAASSPGCFDECKTTSTVCLGPSQLTLELSLCSIIVHTDRCYLLTLIPKAASHYTSHVD